MKQQNSALSFGTLRRVASGHIPGQVVIQFHNRCNAHCPQCGMRVTSRFERSKLEPDTIKRIIDAAVERGVRALSFTGGEPFLYQDELISLIDYAGKAGIEYIRTGTNGFMFRNADGDDFEARITKLAESLARTRLYTFWISVDSADPATHEEMRGLKGIIAGIEKALPIFQEHGIYPSANLGINRNTGGPYELASGDGKSVPEQFYETFRTSFRTFYQFVIDLGFTIVNACYPMSLSAEDAGNLQAVYTATSEDNVINFTDQEKVLLFQALFDTIPEYRSKVRIFTPRTSLHALIKQYGGNEAFAYPCRGGVDFFYIDSVDGNTYPCGYRGSENLGPFWDLGRNASHNHTEPFCKECDWECFRDPSELFGPLLQVFSRPVSLLKRFSNDGTYRRIWWDDVRYYGACDYFSGRKPLDERKLQKFALS
jgi:MoaA/NifB/PqqE/SkfB family radical SAM enzyme